MRATQLSFLPTFLKSRHTQAFIVFLRLPAYTTVMTKRRLKPLKAYKHMRKLIADKEDTTQVFYIIEALDGNNLAKDHGKFMQRPEGQARYNDHRELVPLLDDHDRWKKLPQGTVGRAYVDFMEREGLSAQGLVDEYTRFGKSIADFYPNDPDIVWYGDRRRDVHDMMHVLTDYGRDALGEACVLNFTHSQHGGLGIYFIAHMASLEVRKQAPKDAPVWKAVREAKKLGNLAENIIKQDIVELMAEPLEDARKRLNIQPPNTYYKVHETMRNAGIDPYGVIGAEAA